MCKVTVFFKFGKNALHGNGVVKERCVALFFKAKDKIHL